MISYGGFMVIMFIIYIICVYIEVKLLKRNNIDILYKENLLLVLINSIVFPLAVFTLFFGYNAIKDMSWSNNDVIASGYFFTFIFASSAYIISYIRGKIYAFISRKNKLSFLGFETIYDKNDEY